MLLNIHGQNIETESIESKCAITVGILQGGGSLVGADFEALLTQRVSLHIGAGYIGFGGGINYHLKPSIRSSMLSVAYWHQGVGETYTQSAIGPSFVFRAKKIFSAQLGIGYLIETGPGIDKINYEPPPVLLLYSIGVYFPL